MNCRACVIKHLRMVMPIEDTDAHLAAREFLRRYRAIHGQEEMLALIAEVKSDA